MPKYVIPEDKYAERKDSFRNFKKQMMEKNPNFMQAQQVSADHQKVEAEAIALGSRCQLLASQKLGTVLFVGTVSSLAPGYWVGINLDDAEGNSNGTLSGQQYFEADENHGVFVRPSDLRTGEFPPEEQLEEDDMIWFAKIIL